MLTRNVTVASREASKTAASITQRHLLNRAMSIPTKSQRKHDQVNHDH